MAEIPTRSDQPNDPETYAIIGAAMAVHRELGCGFLEAVYQEALAIELRTRGIPYEKELPIPIFYKSTKLDSSYRADFLINNRVIIELKALGNLGGTEEAQIMNYLKATGMRIGLLINFGRKSLEYRRYIFG